MLSLFFSVLVGYFFLLYFHIGTYALSSLWSMVILSAGVQSRQQGLDLGIGGRRETWIKLKSDAYEIKVASLNRDPGMEIVFCSSPSPSRSAAGAVIDSVVGFSHWYMYGLVPAT